MHSPNVGSAEIQTALRTVEAELLQAVVEGPESLAVFVRTWSALQERLMEAKKSLSLDSETAALANVVATTVMVLSESFIDVEGATSSCHSRCLSEYQEVLDRELPLVHSPSVSDRRCSSRVRSSSSHRRPAPKPFLQTPRYPTTPITSALAPILPTRTTPTVISVPESARSASDPNPLPEFIEHAYKFFATNIFNPYPSRAEKEAIVLQMNNESVTFSSISNWFTNARRRCGWTTILKERCDGNREQLVALATRVFVNPDPQDPVDPVIVRELMEMKGAFETMYERKTRTSAWIEGLEDLIHPFSGASTERPQITEDCRREQEAQEKEREFERQKGKMQAEALRKAEKVTKMMQLELSKQKPQHHKRTASLAEPYPPQQQPSDEDPIAGPIPVAGGKRKLVDKDDDVYRFPDLRQMSLVSRSSSFTSDLSSEGRVPSLTWSDSGDERPYKRSRSSLETPPSSYTSSPRLSPALEIPGSFDYSFNLTAQDGLTSDLAAFNTLFDFSVAPCETLMMRGKKRSHDDEEHNDVASHAKRRRSSQPVVASVGPDLLSSSPSTPPAPSTPLFTPRPSIDATPTQQPRKRSIQLPDLETVLQLDLTQPPPVQIAPPDASLPLDVGVFNWSPDAFVDAGAGDAHADFSHLLQLFGTDGLQVGEAPVEMLPFDLNPTAFQPNGEQNIEHQSALPDDLSGLMSGLMSDQALQEMGMSLSSSLTATPNLSRESSLDPTFYNDVLPSATPADLAEKALRRERKRKELENRRAEIERESARLAELERELEDE